MVLFCSRNCQDKLVGGENEPLDVSSIISNDGAGKETEKVEIWVNGVKRVIFVPIGNNPTTEPTNQCDPSKAHDSFVAADPNPASPVVANVRTSSCSNAESYSRFTAVTCSAGENTVLSKSVSTNTVDQLPNRCVATVAPQINHELGRLLVSSAFDSGSKSKEPSVTDAAAFIKQEKIASATNRLNVRPESVEALVPGANAIGQRQPLFHHRQQYLAELRGVLNANEWHYQDRHNHLQRPSDDEPGRLPITHFLPRNAAPVRGLYTYGTEGSSAQFALPNSFASHYRLPTQVAPYFLHPSGSVPGRVESNHFSGVLGMSGEPAVSSNELCSDRIAQVPLEVPNAPALLGKPAVMVPNLPLERYQHLMATLDPTKQPFSYGRFGAHDNTPLPNIYAATLARFSSRGQFPYPQFPVRFASNEQVAEHVVRGGFPHPQFPARFPSNDVVTQGTSFNNGHRFSSHHSSYIGSLLHTQNQARRELHVPSSNGQPSKIYLSEPGQHLQGNGVGQAADIRLNFKQPEAVPGSSLTLHRSHQNQFKISSSVPEMLQMNQLPARYMHYASLPGCEQVPSLRALKGTEEPTLHVQNSMSLRFPPGAVLQPFRLSAGLAHHDITQSSIFQPMNRILYNNAGPLEVPQFTREQHTSTAFSQSFVSSSQTDSLSQCVTVPGLRLADNQNGSSLHPTWYSSPSEVATFSQNLVSQSFVSPSHGVPLRSVSHNFPVGYSQRLSSPSSQTTPHLHKLLSIDASKAQGDVEVHEVTGLQSHVPSISNSIQVADAFRNSYSNCTEANNRTVLPSSGANPAVYDTQPSVSVGSAVSLALTSTNKGGDKNPDVILTDSNKESSKSGEVVVKSKGLPLCSSGSALDTSHKVLPEKTVSPFPINNLQPSTELQDPRSPLPESPRSQISEIMNSIDKISDDLSMQKWLDSLIGNISDNSRDGFDPQMKQKTSDLTVVNQTSNKDLTTAAHHALVSHPSMTKQVDFKKSKRTWIGIKSIEAEMSPKSSDVKAKRRKRRRLTMKSNQSPEGSDASSDSWHPDSFASSESSMDSVLTSIPSTRTSGSELSWCSDDSVTMGKRRRKQRSRKSAHAKNWTSRSHHRRTGRSHNLSPWRRTHPYSGEIRDCFVSLEVLCLKGKASVNATRASEYLCCSAKTKSCTVQGESHTEDSYGSWCPFKSKKERLLKRGSGQTRNAVKSGSETEDSYSSQAKSKNKKLVLKLRYSKPARNVVMSGSDTE